MCTTGIGLGTVRRQLVVLPRCLGASLLGTLATEHARRRRARERATRGAMKRRIVYNVNEQAPAWSQTFLRNAIDAAAAMIEALLVDLAGRESSAVTSALEAIAGADGCIFDMTHVRTGGRAETNAVIDLRLGYALGSNPTRPLVLVANGAVGIPDMRRYGLVHPELTVFQVTKEYATVDADAEPLELELGRTMASALRASFFSGGRVR